VGERGFRRSLIYPGSKLELINYLDYFKKKSINEDKIYRFLDFLYQEEIKSKIEECVFNHTLKIMNNTIDFLHNSSARANPPVDLSLYDEFCKKSNKVYLL
jgi:hypothetical protein